MKPHTNSKINFFKQESPIPTVPSIKIIGEDHSKDKDYRFRAESLAKQGKFILILEGDNFGHSDNNVYGIEDRIVSIYAIIMHAYFKAISASEKINYLLTHEVQSNYKQAIYDSFFVDEGRRDIAYYIHSIYQLFLIGETNETIANVIKECKGKFQGDLNVFYKFYQAHRDYFSKSFYEIGNGEIISNESFNELIDYFFDNKFPWDNFLFLVMEKLGNIISQTNKYSQIEVLKLEYLNSFIENANKILDLDAEKKEYADKRSSFFQAMSTIVESIMEKSRNPVFAINLLEIAKLPNIQEKEILFIVGNKHLPGLKEILGKTELANKVSYYDKDQKPGLDQTPNLYPN